MAVPDLPDFVTPTARDAIFASLDLDPDFAVSATVTQDHVTVQFVATDLTGRLLFADGLDPVQTVTISVQES